MLLIVFFFYETNRHWCNLQFQEHSHNGRRPWEHPRISTRTGNSLLWHNACLRADSVWQRDLCVHRRCLVGRKPWPIRSAYVTQKTDPGQCHTIPITNTNWKLYFTWVIDFICVYFCQLQLYLIWFGSPTTTTDINDANGNTSVDGGMLGEVALKSGGQIIRVTEDTIDGPTGGLGLVNMMFYRFLHFKLLIHFTKLISDSFHRTLWNTI